MNKKGVFPLFLIVALIVIAVLIIGGGLVSFNLNEIPAFVWVVLIIIVLFMLFGGNKK